MLADMLSGALGVVGFSWVASPAATELETVVMDWLVTLLGLPDGFRSCGTGGGVIQGTASEAAVVTMLAAKARALADVAAAAGGTAPADAASRLVAYGSDQAHSLLVKAASIVGLAPGALRLLPTAAGDGYAMSSTALAEALAADTAAGLIPFFVLGTFGTTSSGACDPFEDLLAVVRAHERAAQDAAAAPAPARVWLHADAAWAGSALVCPEYRPLARGAECADSLDFNPHKWLLTTFDCSCLFVRERKWLLDALSVTPAYLRSPEHDAGLVTDYRDWQLPLGRRFRSLKLWFVLRMYGAERLREHIRAGVAAADAFADCVRADARFELVCPPMLSLVCFRLRPVVGGPPGAAEDARNQALLERLNASGAVYLVSTRLSKSLVLRCAGGGALTTVEHMRVAWAAIAQAACELDAAAAAGASGETVT